MALLKLSLELPEDHSYVRLIRTIGRNILEHHHASAQDVDDIELLVGELCANVTRHAHSEAGKFLILLEHHGDRVVVTVEDSGQGFAVEDLPASGSARPDEAEERFGGYGLHLVKRLADTVEIQPRDPQGMRARVEKRLGQARAS